MSIFSILIWCIFGLIVGGIAKFLTPGKDPAGCVPTILIGVAGSFMGGILNWILGYGQEPLHPSGFFMSCLGGVLALYLYKKFMNKSE